MRPIRSRIRGLVAVLAVAGLAAISPGCVTGTRDATSTDQPTGTTETTTSNATAEQQHAAA